MRPNREPGSRGSRAWRKGPSRLTVALVIVALAAPWSALALSAPAVKAASPVGTVTNYTNPGISAPFRIALGSDGAMWYTNSSNNSIGRVSTDGTVTNYGGVGINRPTDIVAGPDDALWFTNFGGNSIGRITTAGTVTNHTDANGGIAEPYSITLGSDGALWFTNRYGDPSIGRIDPTSKAVTHVHTGDAVPGDIAAGSDGALWFTGPLSMDQSTIWRMTPAGELTSYTDYAHLNGPEDIVAGPDGALWVTQGGDATIGRITTSGVVTSYPSGGGTGPVGIAVGSDGALWFTSPGGPSIGRITTAGIVTTFTGAGSSPQGIAAGSDGNMWFTSSGNDSIGRITAGGVVTTYAGVGIADPQAIALGSDGALWFTDHDNNSLGRVTTGGFVTTITDPGISGPYDIVAAPDGALWFTNQGNHTIGRLDLTTGTVSNYTGGYNGNWISTPLNITVGPDGALWFTSPNPGLGSIARMTLDGTVTARYIGSSDTYDINGATDIVTADGALWYVNITSVGRITTAGATSHWYGAGSSYFSRGLTAGPDGALWLTTAGSAVERLSTDVALEPAGPAGSHWTDYPDAGIAPNGTITAGPDGAMWFTNPGNNTIGRITTGGALSRYTGTGISAPKGITAGPDGAVWFTNPGNNSIGRIESGTQAPQATAPWAPTMDTPSAGDGAVTLAWTAPSSDGGSPITGYKVYQGTTAGVEGTTPVATLGGSATGTEIGSLTNGTTYYFTVRAVNAVGDGAVSNEVSATPAAPLTGTLLITGPTTGRYGESVPITVSGSSGTGSLSFDVGSSTACEIDGGNVVISAGSGSCTVTATRASDGTYASTTSEPFTLAIAKAPLTVTAQDRTITYSQPTPTFGITYDGFVNSDDAADLGGALTYTFTGVGGTTYPTSTTPPTWVGHYSITPSGLTSANYAITFTDGSYTINPVRVTTALAWAGDPSPNPAPVGQAISFAGALTEPDSGTPIGETSLQIQLLEAADSSCDLPGSRRRDFGTIDASGHVTLSWTPDVADIGTHHLMLVLYQTTIGATNYADAMTACALVTVNAAKLDQTITFTAPEGVTYGDTDLILGATASSSLAVSYTSSTPDACTIVAGQLHVVAPGSCTITASQVGNTVYNAAPDVPRTFTIGKAPLTVTAQDRTITYGQATPGFGVSYSGFVGTDSASSLTGTLGYTFAGISPTIFASSGTAPIHAGTYSITPSGLTSDNYAFSYATGTYTINAVSVNTMLTWAGSVTPNPTVVGQEVSFPGLLSRTSGPTISDTTLTVVLREWGDATCSYSSGYVVRDTQHIDASGQVTLHYTPSASSVGTHYFSLFFASQASGDAYYVGSSTICLSVTVNPAKLDQAITFTAPEGVTYGDADLNLGATTTSGLAVSYTSSTPDACTIVDGKLRVVAAGTCTVTAAQTGNANYNPAPSVERTFTIAKGDQEITFRVLPDKAYGDAPFAVSATADSDLPVAFAAAGDCTVDSDGDPVTITGAGTCTVTASQAGNANYNPAPSVERTFAIAKATATAVYSGPTYRLLTSGISTVVALTADVAPAICEADLSFAVTTGGGDPLLPTDGKITLATGLYWIVASVEGANCTGGHDEATISIVSAGDKSNGGGWYKADTTSTGSPRVNFGYTVQSTSTKDKKTGTVTVTYRGQLLWLNNEQWRLKGSISGQTVTTGDVTSGTAPYGTFTCPAAFTSTLPDGSTGVGCGSVSGGGILQRWDAGALAWVDSEYGTVSFTATMYDGGQGKVCKTTGKKVSCTTVDNPDRFGIQFDSVPGDDIRESAPIQLSGGSLKVGSAEKV